MSRLNTDIALQKTLSDYQKARDEIIALLTQADDLRSHADKIMSKFDSFGLPHEAKNGSKIDVATLAIDQRMWQRAFDLTGFLQLMDKEAKTEFHNSLNKNPPIFSIENIRSIFATLYQDADEMFARGIVNVFRRRTGHHKTNTNEPFKIGRKIILPYCTTTFMGYLEINYGSYGSADDLYDMDRVFKTLDDKQHHPHELKANINKAFRESNIYEDNYYRIKGYKNGNLHIEFKRQDLLDKANKIIHDYCGNVLAKDAA